VKEEFPEMAFTLNSLIQNSSFSKSSRKLARQIVTLGFVGSQQRQKKLNKTKLKQAKKQEKERKQAEAAEEEEVSLTCCKPLVHVYSPG
jgi:hypothetical protein